MMTRKIMISKYLLLACLMLGLNNYRLLAQMEVLSPLKINAALMEVNEVNTKKKLLANDTLSLPFKDDFSKPGPYPDEDKWKNSNKVYVNTDFPLNPRNLGVATFDGLNANGFPYKPLNTAGSLESDTLTSKPLHMANGPLLPADSVYLSFCFQSKGLSVDAPESGDDLILDFYDVAQKKWVLQKTINRSGNAPSYDTKFNIVMIAITDTRWFKEGFQFRFRNRSSACGSVDLWHLDNVYLNKNRNRFDTVSTDVSFAYRPGSLLKGYTAMPYKHFKGNPLMGANTDLKIRNNDTTSYGVNVTGYMEVKSNTGIQVYNKNTGSITLLPYFPNGYCNIPATASPNFSPFVYNNGNSFTDSTSFTVRHYLTTSAFDANKANDTITFKQVFNNYFAYDDGTAEAGYQLKSYGAELGIRFEFQVADTLRAVDYGFIPVIFSNQIEQLPFSICVWANDNGHPGTLIYKESDLKPQYSKNIRYPFVRYMLKKGLALQPGTYFIGMKQEEAQPLDIGFDMNTNNQSVIFQNTTGSWATSSFKGSILIRPIVGDSVKSIDGIKTNLSLHHIPVNIYPNPVSTYLHLEFPEAINGSLLKLELLDVLGNKVWEQQINENAIIPVVDFSNGIYLLKIMQGSKITQSRKIIISH